VTPETIARTREAAFALRQAQGDTAPFDRLRVTRI